MLHVNELFQNVIGLFKNIELRQKLEISNQVQSLCQFSINNEDLFPSNYT